MPAPKSVADYLAAQPPATRRVLTQVRAALRKALPKAEEVISYSMPAYRQHGSVVVFFAGWKEHFSLYPVGPAVVAKLGDALAGREVSKGTVRFPLDEKVPVGLIGRIAKHLLGEAAAREAAKVAKKRRG